MLRCWEPETSPGQNPGEKHPEHFRDLMADYLVAPEPPLLPVCFCLLALMLVFIRFGLWATLVLFAGQLSKETHAELFSALLVLTYPVCPLRKKSSYWAFQQASSVAPTMRKASHALSPRSALSSSAVTPAGWASTSRAHPFCSW